MSRAIPQKTLTVYFQEANFKDDNVQVTLEQAIRASVDKLSLVKDRVLQSPSDLFSRQLLNEYELADDHVAISVVEYEEGGEASTVAIGKDEKTISCDVLRSDKGEIIRKDAIALIKGNQILVTGTNRGHEILRSHLPRLFDKAKVINSESTIYVTSKTNKKTVQMIQEKGVRTIAVCSKMQLAEILNAARKKDDNTSANFLQNLLGTFVTKDEIISGDVSAWVEVKRNKRSNETLNEQMIKYAMEIVGNDPMDEYAIYLNGKNEPIRGGAIIQKEEIEVPRHGGSVARKGAWLELRKILNQINV